MIEFIKKIPGLRSRIGRRFILYILLFSSLITFFGVGLQLYLDYDRDLKSIHTTIEQVESSYLDSITSSLWVTDDELLRIQLEGILRLPDMQLIEVRKGAKVLQAVGTPQSESIIEQTIPLVYVYNGRDVHLGELHVVASLKGVYQRIIDRVLVILGIQMVKTLLVSLFIFIIFYLLVGKHIIHMASFVESIRFESMDQPLHLDRKPKPKKPDELDQLAASFNRMREKLARDISERKRAEEALRKSEERYSSIVQNSLNAIIIYRQEEILFANEPFFNIFGYGPKELEGMAVDDILAPEVAEDVAELRRRRMAGEIEKAIVYESKGRRKDGEIFAMEISVSLITYHGEKCCMAFLSDISGRKQAEEALIEAHNIINRSPAVAFLWGIAEGWPVEFVSNNVIELFGYTAEEFTSGKISYAEVIHPDDLERVQEEVKVFRGAEGEDFSHEPYRIVTKDGEIKWLDDMTFTRRDVKGNITHFEGIVLDINKRMNIEKENKKLEAQLQQALKMEAMGTLAGGIAHDFNNLLMAIQGRTSIILMNKDSSHTDFGHLKGIEDNVDSAADLTKQLLGFARGGKYEVTPTDLNELIKKQNRMFGRTKKEITIRGKYEEDLWSVEVDPGQIEQVLLNLYVNAWQAMLGGGDLHLETENVTLDENYIKPFSTEPGRYVKISVTDTGIGMDKATQERIFDPFFTTKEMGRGTGLGLASAYGIIKNHGGFINVYSEKGHGSAFNIFLPASEEEVIEEKKSAGDTLTRLSHFKKKFNISYLLQIKVLQSRLTFLLRRDFVLAANVCSLPSISHKSPCGCLPGCLVS